MNFKPNKVTRTWLTVLGTLGVLGFCTWLATKRQLVLGEEYILSFAYDLPGDLRMFFLVVTLLGSAWIVTIILALLFIKSRFDIALRVIMVSGVTYFVTLLAKELVGRPRPALLTDLTHRELFVTGYGFPSAHTALATALALLLGAYLPRKRWVVVPVWISLVALSRLYLGVHAPLDLIGGLCIGVIVTTCVLLVWPPHKTISKKRLAKTKTQA